MCNCCFREAAAGIHKIVRSDFGPRSDPQGEAQGCAESNLLTPTSFSLSDPFIFLVGALANHLVAKRVPNLSGGNRFGTSEPVFHRVTKHVVIDYEPNVPSSGEVVS